jgi:hypothetical protein
MPLADRHARKAPLYRKVNTRARFHRHRTGPDYRHQRKSKREKIAAEAEVKRGTMKQGVKRGLDYTPLFRFLLKNVGKDWAPVYQEAQSRLDKDGRAPRERPTALFCFRRSELFQRALCC